MTPKTELIDAPAQMVITKKSHHQKELHRLLVEYGSDMLALLDENGNYLYVDGSYIENELGYEPDMLIGINAFHHIHPQDIDKAQEALALITQTQEPIKLSDSRFKTADGQWRWAEITLSNQLLNPAIKALFISFRDITQRKQAQLKLAESEQRFRSLFENNPDMVIYQNEAGIIMDVNLSFLFFIK